MHAYQSRSGLSKVKVAAVVRMLQATQPVRGRAHMKHMLAPLA